MTTYGRGRSKPGKIHLIDPDTYTDRTYVGGSCLCSASACVRMVRAESAGALAIVDCKNCLRMHARRSRPKP